MGYIFFGGDNKQDNYDKGYEAAWEEESAPSMWASKEEKEGYEDGAEDFLTYTIGYDDGLDERRPQYIKDALYMEGYKDGKKDNEKGL